jgi:Protein of unknown function (DUF1552)
MNVLGNMSRRDILLRYGPAGVFALAALKFDRLYGQGAQGAKFIALHTVAGFWHSNLWPTSAQNAPLTAAGLKGTSLEALSDMISRLTVTRGVSFGGKGGAGGGDGHNVGSVWMLTGESVVNDGGSDQGNSLNYAKNGSLDFSMAQLRGREPIRIAVAHFDFGVGRASAFLSYNKQGRANSIEKSPRNVFESIFGAGGANIMNVCKAGGAQQPPVLPPPGPAPAPVPVKPPAPGPAPVPAPVPVNVSGPVDPKVRQGMIDTNLAEFQALSTSRRLSTAEREALKKMIELYSKVETQSAAIAFEAPLLPQSNILIAAAEPVAGQTPLACQNYNAGVLGKGDPAKEEIEKRWNLHDDIVALAFALDLRDAAVLSTGVGGLGGINYLGGNHHYISHGNQDFRNQLPEFDRYHAGRMRSLALKIAGFDAGGVNMLDKTIIYWSSELSEGGPHNHNNVPMFTLGGSALGMPQGQYMSFDGEPNSARYLTALAKRLGVDENLVGSAGSRSGGALF